MMTSGIKGGMFRKSQKGCLVVCHHNYCFAVCFLLIWADLRLACSGPTDKPNSTFLQSEVPMKEDVIIVINLPVNKLV